MFKKKTDIAVLGTGSAVAANLVTNEELLTGVPARKPDGALIDDAWLRRHFGIATRSLDAELDRASMRFTKKSRKEGGLYDGDFSIAAARKALLDANINPNRVDALIHVSATPDTLHFSNHLGHIAQGLELRSDVHLVHLDLGCAGPVSALRIAQGEIAANEDAIVLVVASHCTSSFLSNPEVLRAHIEHHSPWTWLAAAVFGDGAGAMVLGAGDLEKEHPVFLDLWHDHVRDVPIIEFPVGGAISPLRPSVASEAVYVNYADNVNKHYSKIMAGMMASLEDRWNKRLQPILRSNFSSDLIQRWYLHQANAIQIKRASLAMGVVESRVPINMDRLGNTSAASTLILFDEERRQGKISPGKMAVFFWLGASAGAHYGFAVMRT